MQIYRKEILPYRNEWRVTCRVLSEKIVVSPNGSVPSVGGRRQLGENFAMARGEDKSGFRGAKPKRQV